MKPLLYVCLGRSLSLRATYIQTHKYIRLRFVQPTIFLIFPILLFKLTHTHLSSYIYILVHMYVYFRGFVLLVRSIRLTGQILFIYLFVVVEKVIYIFSHVFYCVYYICCIACCFPSKLFYFQGL